jgi:hypothetical protein
MPAHSIAVSTLAKPRTFPNASWNFREDDGAWIEVISPLKKDEVLPASVKRVTLEELEKDVARHKSKLDSAVARIRELFGTRKVQRHHHRWLRRSSRHTRAITIPG